MGENESLNQALIECVKAAGGSKVVGHRLWPEKTVEAAQRHLLACLDEHKQERLSPEHLVMVLRLAREKGHHGGIGFILADLGYAGTNPIEPRDEAAELTRQTAELLTQAAKLADRLQKLQPLLAGATA